jgi:membrane-bound serine protease (ClpP class)
MASPVAFARVPPRVVLLTLMALVNAGAFLWAASLQAPARDASPPPGSPPVPAVEPAPGTAPADDAPSPGAAAAPAGTETPAGAPIVVAADYDGIIHPVAAEFVDGVIGRAEARGAALVVLTLRTPGGLVDSTRTITSRMIAAKPPVAVYIAPSGSRAASAGFLITIAADVAAMAPGTSIGAAHPVSGDGAPVSDTVAKKAASDVAAYARSLAEKRGRNITLAEQAVVESRAFTDAEARSADPPLVDLIARDLDDLLAQLDGREIARFDGRRTVLHTKGASIERIEMTWRQRLLSTIAHPQIAYLLFSLGTLGLTIELWSPGAILPGVVGGVCLLLAFFAFQVLPVNYVGLLLVLFGIVLLILEVKVASVGLLAAGGLVSLVLGSMMLIDSPLPELQVGLRLILPIVFGIAVVLTMLVRLAVRAQRQRSVTGTAGLIGEHGRALSDIAAGGEGTVSAHGETWAATAEDAIAAGDAIEVVAVDGLTLRVRRQARRDPQPRTGN